MTQVTTGKRIGTCDSAQHRQKLESDAKAGQKLSEQVQKDHCLANAESFNTHVFESKMMCASEKGLLCDSVKKLKSDPVYYDQTASNGSRWQGAATACGMKAESITASVCEKAAARKSWDFLAEHCPRDSEVLAKQHCAGRDYTAVMYSEYAPLCGKYGRDTLATHEDGENSGGKGVSEVAKETAHDGALKQLKKLLPF